MKRMSFIVAACMLTGTLSYASITQKNVSATELKTEELGLMLNVLEQQGFTADQIISLLQHNDVAENVHIDAIKAFFETKKCVACAASSLCTEVLTFVQENPAYAGAAIALLIGSGVLVYRNKTAIQGAFKVVAEKISCPRKRSDTVGGNGDGDAIPGNEKEDKKND